MDRGRTNNVRCSSALSSIDSGSDSPLHGKDALTAYTFGTGVAQHTFCSHCGMHAFYVPRSQPDKITVNARCLDGIDGPGSLSAAIGRKPSADVSAKRGASPPRY
jgi:hypothetical protein